MLTMSVLYSRLGHSLAMSGNLKTAVMVQHDWREVPALSQMS